MLNTEADTDRIAPHAARIGVFDRGVRTPLQECVESDEEELFERIMSRLNTDERDCIRRQIKFASEDGANMAPERLIKFIVSFIGLMKADMPRSARIWGIIYLFDLSLHINGKPMSEKARELGINRATLSNSARDASELLRIPPSKWMRSEETVNNNRKARKNHCQ